MSENPKITFTRSSSYQDEDSLNSFVLEADLNGQQVANVLCLDGKWQVIFTNAEGDVIYLPWQDFLEMAHRFSEFVAQENETMLQAAKEKLG